MERVQDLELMTALGNRLIASCSEKVYVHYRSTQQDRSWQIWRHYRPWHYYARVSGEMRARGQVPLSFDNWFAMQSRFRRIAVTDPHRWLVHRIRNFFGH